MNDGGEEDFRSELALAVFRGESALEDQRRNEEIFRRRWPEKRQMVEEILGAVYRELHTRSVHSEFEMIPWREGPEGVGFAVRFNDGETADIPLAFTAWLTHQGVVATAPLKGFETMVFKLDEMTYELVWTVSVRFFEKVYESRLSPSFNDLKAEHGVDLG